MYQLRGDVAWALQRAKKLEWWQLAIYLTAIPLSILTTLILLIAISPFLLFGYVSHRNQISHRAHADPSIRS